VTTALLEDELTEIFGQAGARGQVHAREVDGPRQVGLRADEPGVLASVFKIPVALEVFCQAEEGRLDLQARVRVPVEGRAPGPTGISAMADEVELSVRDLAQAMIAVSDNAATDVVCELVGLDNVAARLDALGLGGIRVPHDCRDIFATMIEDLPGATFEEMLLADPALLEGMRALDPAHANAATPRDTTALLSAIWRDEAGPAVACANVRAVMGSQVWPHRITAGFPSEVAVAGKTGTLPGLQNEAAVVTYPDGSRYAVAVFVRTATFEVRKPQVDRAIGAGARAAVEALRTP